METYGIEMEKYFKFNSSHFIVYKNFRENLHGHNYKVSISIKAEKLQDSFYVIDFGEVKNILAKICDNLKHVLLLPLLNEYIKIEEIEENQIQVK